MPQSGMSASLLAPVMQLWLGELVLHLLLHIYHPCPGMHLSWGQMRQP